MQQEQAQQHDEQVYEQVYVTSCASAWQPGASSSFEGHPRHSHLGYLNGYLAGLDCAAGWKRLCSLFQAHTQTDDIGQRVVAIKFGAQIVALVASLNKLLLHLTPEFTHLIDVLHV